MCQMEFSLTVDVVKKQLPSRNEVSSALDCWTLTNTLAIMSVINYNMNNDGALQKLQLTFDVVGCLFLCQTQC
jgi:hypothetical protein